MSKAKPGTMNYLTASPPLALYMDTLKSYLNDDYDWRPSLPNIQIPMTAMIGLAENLEAQLALAASEDEQIALMLRLAALRESEMQLIEQAESATRDNDRITLTVCANYGGRWDMLQATRAWQAAHPQQSLQDMTEEALAPYLSTADAPEVDLLIRTGGESRVSNFLLWQAAYAELFFTDDLWPEFRAERLHEAIAWFAGRDRRFGSSAPL
mgnify:CR=1 FL=1